MTRHSIIGPSGAARRIQCPQSVTWEAQIPDDPDDADAQAGHAAHWAASEQLAGRLVDEGQIAPNGVVITREMVKGADLYSDDVTKMLAPFGLVPRQGRIEKLIEIPGIHEQSFGTPDYAILIERPGQPWLLLIWDYKFGHRYVEVVLCAQIIDYIVGLTAGLHDTHPGVDVVATIVQPRCYHREGPIRRWKTRLVDLRPQINLSANAAAEALGPNPRLRTGPECRDCKARGVCPQLQREGFASMDEAGRALPLQMTPTQTGVELALAERAIERLQARVTGLRAQVERSLRAGERVPGWHLQQKQSREKWRLPTDQLIAAGAAMGLKLDKPVEALTPRQARDAGLPKALVSMLCEREPAGLELERDDFNAAAKVFT